MLGHPSFVRASTEGGRYWETYDASVVALVRVLGCWRASNLPSPCFLKVCDFNGDEVVCFDTDLEVLILERISPVADRYWAFTEMQLGIAPQMDGMLKTEPVYRF